MKHIPLVARRALMNVSVLITLLLCSYPYALAKPARLVSISVTPVNASIPAGLTQQFIAMGRYSDGSTRDITRAVTWSTSNTAVATIGMTTGLATGRTIGSVTVTAASKPILGSASLQVTARVLRSISVTPSTASISVGQAQQFVATATYSDGSTATITNSANWASSATSVATISTGLTRGIGIGNTTITASLNSVTGTATLSVTAPALVSMSVTPPNRSVPLGQTQQFVATGTYSDGSTQDLTTAAAWSSSAPAVAIVSSTGLAMSQSVGIATITASSAGVSGQTTLAVSPAVMVGLTITPTSTSIPLGMTQQFVAIGTFSDQSNQTVTNLVIWTSSATSVASINNAGLAASQGTGSTTITASSGSVVSNSASLTVLPAVLQSIDLTPADATIALGTNEQFRATGIYSDGSTHDLTSSVTWSSSFPNIAVISAEGLASSVAIGNTAILAAYGSTTGSTTLTVSPAQLVSIAITPAIPAIPLGTTQQFSATGTFTDNTTQDLTSTVHWSSSAAEVATVSNDAGANGIARSLSTGTTTIAATSGVMSGSTTLTVTPAVLVSITVTPTTPLASPGTTQQFIATGTYSDSTTKILTGAASWTSSNPTVATIDETGLASTVASGETTIVASVGAVSGSTILSVTSTVLLSIVITPSSASIPLGTTQQFAANGTYSDGSTQDLTSSVHWSSSDAMVSTISNGGGSNGLATSTGVGSVTITATMGEVSGSALLTITPAQLLSMGVTPPNPAIALGQSQQFTATGTYTDQSSRNVTTNVIWSSSSATVAVVSNSPGSQGLATSSGRGLATITANMGPISASTTLTVGPPQVLSIAVTPANASVALGNGLQFTATGTYTDSTTADLTRSVNWSSSILSVATINAGGTATSVGQGVTTITATSGGISGSTAITVTAPVLTGLRISPLTPSIPVGVSQQFTATASYSDSSTQNVSGTAAWTSSSPVVASINSSGLATGVGQGSTTIRAVYGGYSDSTTLTVSAPVGSAATPTFSPNSGSGSSLTITISTTTTACNSASYIRYTMDGTIPTSKSTAGTSVALNWPGTYTIKAGVFGCPGYADSPIGSSGTYTITPATLFSNGFEAGNLAADGWASCGVAGCSQESSSYITPPNPGNLKLGNYSRQFAEPTLYRYNLVTHGLNPPITSGTLYGRFYMYLGSNCSASSFWVAAILSDDPQGYDTSVYIMTRPDNQLEINVITATTAYVHTTISGGLAMAHWYRVEFSVPVATTASATVEMKVFDGDSPTPLPGGDITLTKMITVYAGGTGHRELDIGASNVQTLCSSSSPATVTIDNVGLGTTGWIGPASQAFMFGLLSDTNGDYQVLPGISTNMAARKPDLILFPGDVAQDTLVTATNFKNAMNGGTTPGNGLFNKTFAVKGNHDQTGSWSGYFDFQAAASTIGGTNFSSQNSAVTCGAEPCKAYSFDFDGSHFVGIDNSGLGVASTPDDLITWLDTDLTNAERRGVAHAFLMWHGPTYWTVTDHASDASAHLIRVLNAHPVIAAIGNGHEHLQEYVRIDSSHRFTNGTVTGPIEQLMSAGADEELYNYDPSRILSSDWAAGYSTGGFFGYSTVTVTGNTIDVRWYNTSNVLQKSLTFSHSR